MAQRAKKPGAIRSAAFRRIRADHSSELAEDYVELIADLIDEKGEARGSDVALRLGVANATAGAGDEKGFSGEKVGGKNLCHVCMMGRSGAIGQGGLRDLSPCAPRATRRWFRHG